MQLRHNCIIVKNIVPLLKKYVVIKLYKLRCSKTNYFIKINIEWVGFNTYCGTRNKKLVRKKSGPVEFSRASIFSRSLARLASG